MNKHNFYKDIKELFIVQEDDGSYNIFGTYLITKKNDLYFVSYINDPYVLPIDFSSLRYAVTYCVFDKNRKAKETKRLYELDRYIGSLNVNIAQHEKMVKKAVAQDKLIYVAKLHEEKLKKRRFLQELEQYLSVSKYMQTNKYKEYQDTKS
jgi:hypothetical protein